MAIVNIDPELCTGCQNCVGVCPVDAIEGKVGEPQQINQDLCVMCGQCMQICSSYYSLNDEETTPREVKIMQRGLLPSVKEPLFAAYNRGDADRVKQALANKDLFNVVQCAPAVRVALAEYFGMPLGSLTPGKMVAALRKLGFNRVYDTNFGADMTIMEEGSELVQRVKEGGVLPMFTSCCPAWVKYIEQSYPELIPHLSSCKSPQQMAGALLKTYGAQVDKVDPANIFSVAVMPCVCKKFECDREEMNDSGHRDVDMVITTCELAHLIKDAGINFLSLENDHTDKPLGTYSGAGTIFGVTGGVTEAALRTAYELITLKPIPHERLDFVRGGEGIRIAEMKVGELTLKIVVVSGLKNAAEVLEQVKAGKADFHFMEVMTCPTGCVSGGGQPKVLLPSKKAGALSARRAGLYQHDENLDTRKSHENSDVKKLYTEFLGKPLGHDSHHLLHTSYTVRKPGCKLNVTATKDEVASHR